MSRAPLVTDYIEANDVPQALALAATEDEEPIATLENYNHHDDVGLVGVARIYHITYDVDGFTEEAVVTIVESQSDDDDDLSSGKFAHAVSNRYDFSEPSDLGEYWERLNEVAEMQTEELDYRESEWRIRDVDDEYAEYFEE